MEKRNLKISYHRAGNGTAASLNLPKPWLKELGISEEEREIELIFDKENNCLVIKKR